MKRDELKTLGLTEEQIDKIMAENGKDIESLKGKISTIETELKSAKDQLTEANSTIEGFKKLDVESIQKAADEWKTKAETIQTEAQKQVAQLKFDHALDGALTGAKAKNAKAVKALLDLENLKLNETDGSVIGLEDQLNKIKEANDFLFENDKQPPTIVVGGNNQSVLTDKVVEAARKAAGLITPEGK